MAGPLRARVLSWRGFLVLAAIVVVTGFAASRSRGSAEGDSPADKRFAKVCREHGGEPSFAAGSGDYVKDARSCEIEYGGEHYEMYAVHPEGFSAREAAQAKASCTLLARQTRRDAEATGMRASARVVWHPRSAICESQR